MKTMWKISFICNTLLMCVCGLASAASQIRLRNAFVLYPHSTEGMALPPLSEIALKVQWAYLAIPCIWVAIGVLLIAMNRRNPEPPRDLIQLHTSATLLIGLSMLVFFTVSGVMPFIPLIVRMAP